MSSNRYLSAKQASSMLNISLSTLYAYVSRGLIRSESSGTDTRKKRYYREDVEKLIQQKEASRNPEKLVETALHFGAPVLESRLSLIMDGRLYYRGLDVSVLATESTVEDVAELLWVGNVAQGLFTDITLPPLQDYIPMLADLPDDLPYLTQLQMTLPLIAAGDYAAYDLRAEAVMQTGARIMKLMVSIVTGDIAGDRGVARTLQETWAQAQPQAKHLINAALILCADHELNASSFTARIVASAGATPYSVVMAGLSAVQGIKHGGSTARVEAFLREVESPQNARRAIAERLQRGESINGFGHPLYPDRDPRADTLLSMMRETYPDHPVLEMADAVEHGCMELIGLAPNIDFALMILARLLNLRTDGALTLFALGRVIGWVGHAIEQYEENRLIRPRAKYVGEPPQ